MQTVSPQVLGEESPACRVAVRRYEDSQRNLTIYHVMIAAFSAILLSFLVLAIILFIVGKNTSGLVSLVGTVSTSAGALFVLKNRNNAKSETDKAVRDVHSYCESADVNRVVTS